MYKFSGKKNLQSIVTIYNLLNDEFICMYQVRHFKKKKKFTYFDIWHLRSENRVKLQEKYVHEFIETQSISDTRIIVLMPSIK